MSNNNNKIYNNQIIKYINEKGEFMIAYIITYKKNH